MTILKIEKRFANLAISEILAVLREIGQGSFYVKTGIIFRDAVLKCKVLLNSEVWHCLTSQQVEILESIDKQFIRTILKSHSKVSIECLYLETGKYPYKYDIMWKLLHVEEDELRQIERDRKKLKLNLNKNGTGTE